MRASTSFPRTRTRALVAIVLTLTWMTWTLPASAQEAPPVAKTHDGSGLLPEPDWMTTAFDFGSRYNKSGGSAKDGFYPQFGGLFTGAGWLSVGGGYRRHVLNDVAVIDGSGSVSWRGYKLAQGRFELPLLAHGHVSAGVQATWQDLMQINYFGIGPDSLEGTRSEYRMKTQDLSAFASYRPARWLAFTGQVGWMDRPTLSSPAGPFDRGYPDARGIFPDEPAFSLARQPSFLHSTLSVSADTRDYPSHPMSGAFYRAAWTMYSDGTLDLYTFQRYEAEGLQVVPLMPERFAVLLHGWTVSSATTSDQTLPVYMLPSLGGSSTLRSFSDFRFHDRNMLVASAEARVALFTHIDAATFVDAGNVAARFADLNLDKRSYGVGLRIHAHRSTTARIDLANGAEGWRLTFSLNDPFRFGRLSRAAIAVPFAP